MPANRIVSFLIVWISSLFVAVGSTEASPLLRAHAVIDEAIVPEEATDIARAAAFVRARLEVIETLAKAARARQVSTEQPPEALEAWVADHLRIRMVRELEQDDERQRHVLVEIEGVLEALEPTNRSPHVTVFDSAKEEFQSLASKTGALRRQVLQEPDALIRADLRVQLEVLGIATARLACFAPYSLAGEEYCAAYRPTVREGYRLANTVIRCGGVAAWRRFSPFYRLAVYFSLQVEALRQRQLTPEQVLWRHLQHKQVVLAAYPYLRQSKELPLLEPIEWPDANGSLRRVPVDQWTATMIATVLERELALWGGITAGWTMLIDALSAGECAREEPRSPDPTLVQQDKPAR